MTIPTPPSTVQDVEGLIEEAAEVSRFLRSPDSRGAWLKINLLLMARVYEQLADALRSTTRQLEVAEEALREAEDLLSELNPNNYSHDDVCQLNDDSIAAILRIRTALTRIAALKEKTDE